MPIHHDTESPINPFAIPEALETYRACGRLLREELRKPDGLRVSGAPRHKLWDAVRWCDRMGYAAQMRRAAVR
jgi:hypothetical protein